MWRPPPPTTPNIPVLLIAAPQTAHRRTLDLLRDRSDRPGRGQFKLTAIGDEAERAVELAEDFATALATNVSAQEFLDRVLLPEAMVHPPGPAETMKPPGPGPTHRHVRQDARPWPSPVKQQFTEPQTRCSPCSGRARTVSTSARGVLPSGRQGRASPPIPLYSPTGGDMTRC